MIVHDKPDRKAKVRCDDCKAEFVIANKSRVEGNYIVHYFNCPKCKREFFFGADTQETVDAKKAHQKLKDRFNFGKANYSEVKESADNLKDICTKALTQYKEQNTPIRR